MWQQCKHLLGLQSPWRCASEAGKDLAFSSALGSWYSMVEQVGSGCRRYKDWFSSRSADAFSTKCPYASSQNRIVVICPRGFIHRAIECMPLRPFIFELTIGTSFWTSFSTSPNNGNNKIKNDEWQACGKKTLFFVANRRPSRNLMMAGRLL